MVFRKFTTLISSWVFCSCENEPNFLRNNIYLDPESAGGNNWKDSDYVKFPFNNRPPLEDPFQYPFISQKFSFQRFSPSDLKLHKKKCRKSRSVGHVNVTFHNVSDYNSTPSEYYCFMSRKSSLPYGRRNRILVTSWFWNTKRSLKRNLLRQGFIFLKEIAVYDHVRKIKLKKKTSNCFILLLQIA